MDLVVDHSSILGYSKLNPALLTVRFREPPFPVKHASQPASIPRQVLVPYIEKLGHLLALSEVTGARYFLPQGSTTRMYVTGNFQAWADFLKNRLDKAAQWEIREVAQEIQRRLARVAPNVFGKEDV